MRHQWLTAWLPWRQSGRLWNGNCSKQLVRWRIRTIMGQSWHDVKITRHIDIYHMTPRKKTGSLFSFLLHAPGTERRRIMKAAGHLSTEDLTWFLARQVTTLKHVRACWQRMWPAERLAACKACVAAIWNQMSTLQTDRTCCKLQSLLAMGKSDMSEREGLQTVTEPVATCIAFWQGIGYPFGYGCQKQPGEGPGRCSWKAHQYWFANRVAVFFGTLSRRTPTDSAHYVPGSPVLHGHTGDPFSHLPWTACQRRFAFPLCYIFVTAVQVGAMENIIGEAQHCGALQSNPDGRELETPKDAVRLHASVLFLTIGSQADWFSWPSPCCTIVMADTLH